MRDDWWVRPRTTVVQALTEWHYVNEDGALVVAVTTVVNAARRTRGLDAQMDHPPLTDAQRHALAWLPADGSWRSDAGDLYWSLEVLSASSRPYVERDWLNEPPAWRLTESGQHFAAKIGADPQDAGR